MLEKQFIESSIRQIGGSYKLEIVYKYYGLYLYTDVFCYKTLNEAKDKLILERCHQRIKIYDEKNNIIDITTGPG